jgi:RimJ/RimL family protein N-acetyltransferase
MANKEEYNIVPITLAHLEGFRSAVDSVAREKKYLSFLEGPSFDMSKAFVEENIKGNWPHVVAIAGGTVVGWCDITSFNRPVYAHCGELGIGVIPSCRGKGIGKALMIDALRRAKEKGLERIELTVFEKNVPAIALYQQLGFVVEGKKKNAVKIDGQYDDLICMALQFDDAKNKHDDKKILEELKNREPIFHHPDKFGRTESDILNQICDEFWEVGASGNVYTKEVVLATLLERYNDPNYQDIWEAKDFALTRIAQDNYLLTYTLIQDKTRLTKRSTLWRRENGAWKILYHQGTVVS